VPQDHIILAGISQGCATAILTLLTSEMQLGGFIGLCSWLPFQEEVKQAAKEYSRSFEKLQSLFDLFPAKQASSNQLKTPVFLSHSKDDDVVPVTNGEMMSSGLKGLGMNVTWRLYEDGGHWVNEPQGVDDMVQFLKSTQST